MRAEHDPAIASGAGVRSFVERRPRVAGAIAPAFYGIVALCLILVSLEPRFATPWWITVPLGIAGLVLLVFRARHPQLTLAVAIVLALVSVAVGTGAESVLVLIALSGVGVRRPAPVAWLWFTVATVCGALAAWIFGTRLASGPSLWGSPPVTPRDVTVDVALAFAVVLALLLITQLLGTGAGQRRRYVAALVDRAERLARERDQQAEIATARERERIAREMHDVIAHSLSVMIAMADGAHESVDARPDEARTAIGRVAETGRRTLGEVRRLLGSVRAEQGVGMPVDAPQPGARHIDELVAEFREAGLPVQLTVSGKASDDPALGLTVYRLVQESLTNVLRHARAVERVRVELSWSAGEVMILVRDRSAVAVSSGSTGRGILGMRERVALFDGSVEAGPLDGGGWQVSALLRWEERA